MPTIENGSKHMQAVTYTGTGATQTISGLNFQPDLIWIKSRSAATDHKLTDSVRGVTKSLESNTTDAEATDANGVTAITSTGFTLGSDSVYNNSGATYVAWCWKAGEGASSSNTAGSQTSTVSVNASAGFSIATFTCTGVNVNGTVGHGLGVAPKLIITKSTGSGSNWVVYHSSVSTDVNKFLRLNDTSATVTLSNVWGDALPTSTVFGIRGDVTLAASATAVAYCWSEVAGFSKFGSYTGNGSTDGPFIYLGFRPKFVLFKASNNVSGWMIADSSRSPTNVSAAALFPNSSNAEYTIASDVAVDFLSNGVKIRGQGGETNYYSGGTYIYAAFAESPFKHALGR